MKVSYITSHKGDSSDLVRCTKSVELDCQILGIKWEHLVALDGYSNEEASSIEKKITRNSTKIFHSSENIGKAAWVNRLINEADGDVIYFLDSDDFVLRGRTSQQMAKLESDDSLDCVGSNYLRWDRKKLFKLTEYPENDIDIKRYFWKYPCLLYSSLAMKMESYKENGLYFRDDLKGGIDYEFYSRLLASCKVANINRPLVVYTHSKDGITSKSETRIAQLRAHEDVLRKLFSLQKYNGEIIASLMMKYILGQADNAIYSKLRKEILDYLKAVKDESGNHRYFRRYINNHELECILMEI